MTAEVPEFVERRAPVEPGWHLKKEIQLGHVFTTLTVAFSCYVYVSRIENRLTLVEQQTASAQIAQHERDDRQDKTNAELMQLVRTQLERMEVKIDKIAERRQ
jgi:hypothetical protein